MLQLWFNSIEEAQLSKIRYRCPLTRSELWSYRGRGALRGDGSFHWTAGVKGLCALLLSLKLHGIQRGLSGEKGSLAASLDFALGKPPAWILEMFGTLPNGASVATKLFIRLNPEGKRSDPFEVKVSPQLFSDAIVQIYVNGIIADSATTHLLFERLHGSESEKNVETLLSNPDFINAVDHHMTRSYASIDIFTEHGRTDLLKRVYNHPGFKKYAPSGARVTHAIDDSLSTKSRLGIIDDEVLSILRSRAKSLRITSNMPTIPITSLFRYLKRLYDLPLEIDMSHLHAAEVGKRIISEDFITPPDLCVLGIGPSCAILSQGAKAKYVPLTPLPGTYDEVLSGLQPQQMKPNSSFSFIDDFPSTPRLFFERLTDSKRITSRSNPVTHFEPADAIAMTLSERNARTIQFFPYNVVAKLHYGLHSDSSLGLGGDVTEMFLFGTKEFASDKIYLKAFLTVLRDAWLRLRANPALREALRAELITSEEFRRIFTRAVEIPLKLAA